ncbi:MAG: phosphopentomutase [Bacteroidetes bacterium]|nr:phosphopentomutase [Bacteroidota bacterium]
MVFVTIVLDGVGIGEQPDAPSYGDQASDTLGHVLARERPHLPNLTHMGLGCIRPLESVAAVVKPLAQFGKMMERSAGKDSTTGHWEMAGIHLKEPLPTFPDGFPTEVVSAFCASIGVSGVLGNRAESGTVIIQEFGDDHIKTGNPILYTSADSVFQIATHVDVVPLETLYRWSETARKQICVGSYNVGRVIARPFAGSPGSFHRLSLKRKDYSRLPHRLTLQEALQKKGVRTVSIGKVADLFGGVGFDESHPTGGNRVGIETTLKQIKRASVSSHDTFIWVNLIDFDQEYGHRNNPEGFARSLEQFDACIPELLSSIPQNGRLVITADHGNDPTTPGSDHSREFVPLLYYGASGAGSIGTRTTFADHAATVSSYFGVHFDCDATPF